MRVLIMLYGQRMIKSGQMTPGNLVSFILYQMEIGGYVQVRHNFTPENYVLNVGDVTIPHPMLICRDL